MFSRRLFAIAAGFLVALYSIYLSINNDFNLLERVVINHPVTVPDRHNSSSQDSYFTNTSNATNIDPRSYSIRPGFANPGPWPRQMDRLDPSQYNDVTAESRRVRYCFTDDTAADALYALVRSAIARWAPAMSVSSVAIMPDDYCVLSCPADGSSQDWNYKCICSDNTDAVRISHWTWDADSDTYPTGSSTTGYYAYSNFNKMHIKYPTSSQLAAAQARNADLEQAGIITMAHEFGHVMGLVHEHQRADRDFYVDINWSNIPGYSAVVNDQDTMDAICVDYDIEDCDFSEAEYILTHTASVAVEYLPVLLEYMPYPDKMAIKQADWKRYFVSSRNYDYDSIMGYNSDENYNIVTRKYPDGTTGPIYQGGSSGYSRKGISPADIGAVAVLYPQAPSTEPQKDAEDRTGNYIYVGDWSSLVVWFGTTFTTTVPNSAATT